MTPIDFSSQGAGVARCGAGAGAANGTAPATLVVVGRCLGCGGFPDWVCPRCDACDACCVCTGDFDPEGYQDRVGEAYTDLVRT